jgi:predicted ATPase
MGWRVMGTTNHYAGQQQEARRFFESYVAGYAPPRGERHLTWLHYDGPVLVRARLARVLWLQGLTDQATDLASANIAGARLSGHKLSVCLAIGEAACPIAIMTGDFTKAEEQLAELVEIATKQSYSSWIRMARCLEGKLLVQRGETARGVAVLREAIGSFGAAQQSLHYFGFVSDLVEALTAEGAMNEAEATLEQALLRSEQSGVKWHVAELLRVRGQLRLSRDGNVGANHARHDFEAAIELARDQGAFLWELRAALSLARLDTAHGRASQARSLLRGVFDRVTEGFGTVDVQAAQRLLAELSESPLNS